MLKMIISLKKSFIYFISESTQKKDERNQDDC